MQISADAVVARFRGKAFRYTSVSVIATVITQVQVVAYVDVLGWHGATANVAAVACAAVPAFHLNRRWVWGRPRGGHRLKAEVAPFVGMNLAGLVLSTLFAWGAYRLVGAGWAVSLASMAGFGALWVVKFVLIDEYLFHERPHEVTHRVRTPVGGTPVGVGDGDRS